MTSRWRRSNTGCSRTPHLQLTTLIRGQTSRSVRRSNRCLLNRLTKKWRWRSRWTTLRNLPKFVVTRLEQVGAHSSIAVESSAFRSGSRVGPHLYFGKPWRRHSSQHPLAMVRFFLDAAHHGLSESRRLHPLAVENRESFRSLHRFKRIWTLHHSHTLVPPSKTPSTSNKHLIPAARPRSRLRITGAYDRNPAASSGEQAN